MAAFFGVPAACGKKFTAGAGFQRYSLRQNQSLSGNSDDDDRTGCDPL